MKLKSIVILFFVLFMAIGVINWIIPQKWNKV